MLRLLSAAFIFSIGCWGAAAEPDGPYSSASDGSVMAPPGAKIARCELGDAAAGPGIQTLEIEDRAYFLSTAKWPSRSIYVCWINPAPENESERGLVRESVEATWEAHSTLAFKGWGVCTDGFAGIRIAIEDAGPHVTALGRGLAEAGNRMLLNFTYENWSPDCKTMKAKCNRSIAVHEFGHAIGFAHEQNRPDTPGECAKRRQGTDGDLMLTPWDLQSVMNYCNPIYNNDGQLSLYDIDALKKAYSD